MVVRVWLVASCGCAGRCCVLRWLRNSNICSCALCMFAYCSRCCLHILVFSYVLYVSSTYICIIEAGSNSTSKYVISFYHRE